MNKYITISLIVLVILIVFAFRDKLKRFIPGSTPAPVIAPGTPPPAGLDTNKVLKRGDRGEEVKFLQGLLGITADGIFGAQTEAALKARKGIGQTSLSQYSQLSDVETLSDGTADYNEQDPGDHWYDNLPLAYMFQ